MKIVLTHEGDFYLSYFAYKEVILEQEPVFLGPGFLHKKKDYHTYLQGLLQIKRTSSDLDKLVDVK